MRHTKLTLLFLALFPCIAFSQNYSVTVHQVVTPHVNGAKKTNPATFADDDVLKSTADVEITNNSQVDIWAFPYGSLLDLNANTHDQYNAASTVYKIPPGQSKRFDDMEVKYDTPDPAEQVYKAMFIINMSSDAAGTLELGSWIGRNTYQQPQGGGPPPNN